MEIILGTVLGVILLFAAYGIVNFIFSQFKL